MNQDENSVRGYIEHSIPLKRFAVPEEVVDAIVFFASDRISFITGATLLVDGRQNRAII